MSLHDYQTSKTLAAPSFEALIMAAYRQADTYQAMALQTQWPAITQELLDRYAAPGGVLSTDPEARR